jgi:hypothetical protein
MTVFRLKLAALALVIFAATAQPALGAFIVNAANTGTHFTVDYVGQVGGQTTPSVSALGTFTFNGVSNNGFTYNFNYSLTNDSTTSARLSGFAFNTNPNASSATVTGAFNNSYISGNYPEGYGSVDVCFTDGGGSCAGGGSGGFYNPNTGTGSFALTFAQQMASVSLDSFVTRFQSISGVQAGTSGIGIGSLVDSGAPVSAAPEPGTWLMLLGGFGLMGWAMRRRPNTQMAWG